MLPVLEIEREIVARLKSSNRLVLTAPTGSGKTTQVPQILFRSGLIKGQIIVLQPRRLATRMVAQRVAREMKCELGSLVGYQTRFEREISKETRIRFMTEGLLPRLLQSDPQLREVGAVILDEFHERSLHADMSLGLLQRAQETGRGDLRLMVMSATLDVDLAAAHLKCEVARAGGRLFPIDVRYLPKPSRAPVWEVAANAMELALRDDVPGDMLIFMPGVYEINRTLDACRDALQSLNEHVELFPLHGSLRPNEQDAALTQCPQRKVVVATNVAETSLTIEGIRIVIDSGQARINRHLPQRGLNVLRIEPISRDSADQRAGRAGRTAPGVCLRLWTEREHAARDHHQTPEVRRLELSEAVLQLKAMGVADVSAFPWLEPPEHETIRKAETLLHSIDALDERGGVTDLGRVMAEFPAHPRLSRFMLDASQRDCLGRAIVWAALINERDILHEPAQRVLLRFTRDDEAESDLAARERLFEELKAAKFGASRCEQVGANAATCRDVERAAESFARICRRRNLDLTGPNRTDDLLQSLLVAFHDHLAVRLDAQRPHCAMTGRRKVVLDRESVVRQAGLIVALDVREIGHGDKAQTMLALASRVEPAWLEEIHPAGVTESLEAIWNAETKSVEQVERRLYHGLEIARTARPQARPQDAAEILVDLIMRGEVKLDHWDEKVEQWIARARLVSRWFPERGLISYDDQDMRVILHEIVAGAMRLSQIKDKPCLDAVRGALSWADQQLVEKMAPESIALPNGFRMKLQYSLEGPPKGRAKIQDLYDLHDTPRVAGGRQEVLLEILGPNYRPVQVTADLKNFWQSLYPELKKELRRRYPKHEWR